MAAPVVQSLEEILAGLEPAYAGVRQNVQAQQALIPQKFAGQRQAAEVAKTNTFRDIRTGAARGGNIWSGMPIEEQTRYLGEKYLPSLTNLSMQENTENLSLAGILAQLEQEKRLKGIDTRGTQQRSYDEYQQQQERIRQEQEFARWQLQQQQAHDRNMAAIKNRYDTSGGRGGTDIQLVKNKNGGWDVYENGKKSSNYDLGTAATLMGRDVVQLLRQGDAKDRQAAAWYDQKLKKYGNKDEAKYFQELMRDRSTAFYLGGAR